MGKGSGGSVVVRKKEKKHETRISSIFMGARKICCEDLVCHRFSCDRIFNFFTRVYLYFIFVETPNPRSRRGRRGYELEGHLIRSSSSLLQTRSTNLVVAAVAVPLLPHSWSNPLSSSNKDPLYPQPKRSNLGNSIRNKS